MRKLKGVIGAIVVVIALMGSVLAGYALNVNGSTEIVNGYEKVTDVSGLYSHSQEKTFIEYNPASNYIGYQQDTAVYNNNAGEAQLKIMETGTVFYRGSDGHVLINGVDQGIPPAGRATVLISDKSLVYKEPNKLVLYRHDGSSIDASLNSDATFTINGNNITASMGGNNYTLNNSSFVLAFAENGDYYSRNVSGSGSIYNVYLNNKNQIYSYGYIGKWGVVHNDTWYGMDSNNGQTASINIFSDATQIAPGIDYYSRIGRVVDNFNPYLIFWPKSVNNGYGLGIDYTESSRVNNYPIEYRSSSSTDTTTQQLDLQALATTDYWPQNENWVIDSWWNVGEGRTGDVIVMAPRFSYVGSTTFLNTIHKYKLSDMLPAMNLPADTTKVSMDLGNIDNTVILQSNSDKIGSTECIANFTAITTDAGLTDRIKLGSSKGFSEPFDKNNANYRIDYYPANGMCDIFSYNGVKKATAAVDSVYIQFVSASAQYGRAYFTPAGGTPSILDIWYSPNQSRPHPFLNLEITSQTATGTPVYMDPTKGLNIKSTNLGNVTWNNEYENGIIKILFRAGETFQTYHNEFTISGNDVAVDYTDGKFSVSLNGGDPVDIGRWRNIVLDLNLQNGTLTVIPVRTFNSYTNVELDTTNIPIGELVNSTTTNTIVWKPTPNSFRFNIYSTDVFLDTYGTVMVNPSLDVQQYFTQLNNFYRLELRGFTVVGDSLTINGITGSTSGQNITFNDQILSLKNLDVTYADGKVTVGDGNISVDLGEIQNTVISGIGTWYFTSQLDRGFTESKQIYTWDWGDFIFNNTQFCVIFIGLVIAGLIAGRRVSSFGVVDYAIMGIAIAIALTTQVIA